MNMTDISKFIEKNKLPMILITLAVVGVVLLIFSEGGSDGSEVDTYADNARIQIERIAERISGHPATVIVTLECGYSDEYAVNGDGEYALAGGKPVSVGKTEPKIRGVTIVCKNGNDPGVQMKMISAVCCAYGIGQSRVYVCEGK